VAVEAVEKAIGLESMDIVINPPFHNIRNSKPMFHRVIISFFSPQQQQQQQQQQLIHLFRYWTCMTILVKVTTITTTGTTTARRKPHRDSISVPSVYKVFQKGWNCRNMLLLQLDHHHPNTSPNYSYVVVQVVVVMVRPICVYSG